jgi:integrase
MKVASQIARFLFPLASARFEGYSARSLRESFRLVRGKAEMPWVGSHDLRHFSASQCVMAGIEFMTIASWLGHQDGAALVGKVYD